MHWLPDHLKSPTVSELLEEGSARGIRSRLWDYLSYNLFWLPRREKVSYNYGFSVTDSLLDKFIEESDKINATLVVVRIVGKEPENEVRYRDRLRTMVRQKKLVYIDTEPYFEEAYTRAPKENFWNVNIQSRS